MNSGPSDQEARDRFSRSWEVNLAVVANAGSGKTTAISERLASIALSAEGPAILRRTAVVTYTKKAAVQIGQRARSVLMRRLAEGGPAGPDVLARLDGVFFGTIHSFCLKLADSHGSPLGVHRNPTLVEADDEEETWQEFLEQDAMAFSALAPQQIDTFLRFAPLDVVFELARDLGVAAAQRLRGSAPSRPAPAPDLAALASYRAQPVSTNRRNAPGQLRNRQVLESWAEEFATGRGRLPLKKPQGKAEAAVDAFHAFFRPVKEWLAEAGGVLAGELSLRYHDWRRERGIQTYADQIESALGVLQDPVLLEEIRAEGWRVVLDEAQDTDPQQFAVLVEITRPAGAVVGTWPRGPGPAPRPGHFCLVGDPQQSIYSDRADIINFQDHVGAFARGDGGERLGFDVTFRAPRQVVDLLNTTLPAAFGPDHAHNFGLPPEEGAQPPFLQATYEPLVVGPRNQEGRVVRVPFSTADVAKGKEYDDRRLAMECAELARVLKAGGPAGVGADAWGDICILAPRVAWLPVIRDQLEKAGLKTALQMRRNRSGDNPVYAWLCGLLAVVCDPADTFEWVGVLREVFAVSDAVIAQALKQDRAFVWDDAERHPAPIAEALGVLRPFITRADDPGDQLLGFATGLVAACGLGARARALDPEGNLEDELDRLVARAADLGSEGGGPRQWRADLLGSIESFRAAGRPARDALNLMSCHSAKGLEWPVVIPVGLWRKIYFDAAKGLRVIGHGRHPSRVVFDNDGLGQEDKESMVRAQVRDLVRLLYVTLTRPKAVLVVPWAGGRGDETSFARLWGFDPSLLPAVTDVFGSRPAGEVVVGADVGPASIYIPLPGSPAPALPLRVLPHQLATKPDLVRSALHESSQDLPSPVRDAVDPLDYGVWWHEMLEFVPWKGDDAAVAAHGAAGLARAEAGGYGARGGADWARLLASAPWRQMREGRWNRLAEVGVFAPLGEGEWIDGVIDLVLHDPVTDEVSIVDWKTNRRHSGEADGDLLARLASEYYNQLAAYGTCAAKFFPGSTLRLLLYSTEAGAWTDTGPAS